MRLGLAAYLALLLFVSGIGYADFQCTNAIPAPTIPALWDSVAVAVIAAVAWVDRIRAGTAHLAAPTRPQSVRPWPGSQG